jgi:hypothetical protein
MRDPENGRPRRLKSVPLLLATELRSMTAVAAVPGFDSAKTPILLLAGGLAIDESDIERCPGRGRAIHEDSEAIIVRRDFAEHARDGRRSSSNTGKAAGEKAAGHTLRLPFPCAGRGYARRLGSFSRPCTEHRVHNLANIRGKNCFAENQESLELVEIGNS